MDSSRWLVEWLFWGFVAILLGLDLLLLVAAPSDGSAGGLRVLLAVGAGLIVPLAVILGVVIRPAYAVGGLVAVPLVVAYVVSGLLLPWNQLAFYTGQRVLETVLVVPALGDQLATVFFGGHTLSRQSHQLAFRYHYTIVGIGLVGLVVALGAGVYSYSTTRESGE
ncbi:hypothetical protein [Haloarchaeobius sp. HRN-SO-5]|uniref:hypothetical protein n=1 Tax=Haloarchaeobius sp. HRN-SO-5 TaxID=3446118 RepID=UPI003EBC3B0D